jgi:hypothetical protein
MNTSLRQRVIRYFCAKDKDPSDEALAAYFHAFEGGFDNAPFTLYVPLANKLVLYVYEENCGYLGGTRRGFNDKCRKILEALTEIAGVLADLAGNGYLTLEYSEKGHGGLPAGYTRNWRRYENIFPDESEALLYIMSVKITPAEKLYRLNRRHSFYADV